MTLKMSDRKDRSSGSNERLFLGQPWGVANLFSIELWERFSFYGMQAILVFYMYYETTRGGLGLDKAAATSIIGAYGGLVYLACLVAALVADRILGSERTLFYSAIMVLIGHVCLAIIPGVWGLAAGLLLIAFGSGGVKTNAQVVLGNLYERTDPRRDAGFSIFYLGINIGALFGPLMTAYLQSARGFHYGFGLAAIGMALGLAQYAAMRSSTIGAAGGGVSHPLPRKLYPVWGGVFLLIAATVAALIITGIVKLVWLSSFVAVGALIAAIGLWLQMYRSPLCSKEEKRRLIGFIPIFVSSVLFWAIFNQQFTVIAIYADERLNRNIFGWEFPAGMVQSINPIFIILLANLFALMWTKLGSRQWSTPVKFGVSNILMGVAVFGFIPFAGGGANSTPLMVLVGILLVFTIAELLLSPVGNSVATKLAPSAFASRMFACWMMTFAIGTALAGSLARFYDPTNPAAEQSYFLTTGIAAIILGVILLLSKNWVLRQWADIR